ncbi:MAG: hypothetical protein KAW41_06075 [Candidatus Diapherotrites archaeon]|nr:hypothetical protein [Candidatus Diapherotrites archaeon]
MKKKHVPVLFLMALVALMFSAVFVNMDVLACVAGEPADAIPCIQSLWKAPLDYQWQIAMTSVLVLAALVALVLVLRQSLSSRLCK